MATTRKLVVEVVDATNLLPKDGHGTSSPYVVIDYYGQRRRTQTVVCNLKPTWNEVLEFTVPKRTDNVFGDMLEIDVYHDRNYGPTRRNNFLGRIRMSSRQFVRKGEEALVYYLLEKKSLFSWIQGEIGLKIYYVDQAVPPPPPLTPPPPIEETKAGAPQESDQPEPPAEVAGGDLPIPADHSEADSGKPSEAPAAKSAPEEPEKPPEPDPPFEEASAEPVEEIPVEPQPDAHQEDPSKWVQSQERMAATIPDIRVAAGVQAPRPISRTTTAASFTSDLSETIERLSFDLVEKMHYLFVRVVKAKSLPTNGGPVVKIAVAGKQIRSRPARKTGVFEWDQTFAFGHDQPESSSILEISVWDHPPSMASDAAEDHFLGGICFDVTEIPLRDPPDSPLAPQWYRLEGGGAPLGDLMLATWVGTQADESFPEAWKTDTAGNVNGRAKVYISPKLWYLRATVLEAQDILPSTTSRETSFQVKAQLGFQIQKTKISVSRDGNLSWNEDLMFVAAEPFSDQLIFTIENRSQKGSVTLGVATIPLTAIERRIDDRKLVSRWFTLEDQIEEKRLYKGRVHLGLCFDGGYHVMDEAAHVCSDYRPTARQLWKPPIGMVELGIIGCKNLLPIKTIDGKGFTDAYCVAKYGPKWVRTRTISNCLEPKWNEQYTWKVYDPCTVLSLAVFDSSGVLEIDGSKEVTHPDYRIGKVRIRISTLETSRIYRHTYPLLVWSNTGMKKMGDVEIAIRFIRSSPRLDFINVYTQPLLPLMHHIKPLGVAQQDLLRNTAVQILAAYLSRSEPPIKREVVLYMLDAESQGFSMRKVRANWLRIVNVIAGVIDIVRWVEDTRSWKNPTATILVHALVVMLVWFPDLIIPTLAFYTFVIGVWNYRFRLRNSLPHFSPKMSLAETIDRDELDEEFDRLPSSRGLEVVGGRYDKLRIVGARVQTMLGDLATQLERVQALVTWGDPRATGIFIGLCFIVAMVMYLVPSKMVAMAFGFYYLRHPLFRDRMPSPVLNFFRRLPSLSDRIM